MDSEIKATTGSTLFGPSCKFQVFFDPITVQMILMVPNYHLLNEVAYAAATMV
jgi:hypothetical protein